MVLWIDRALGIPMDDDRAAFKEAWKYRAAVRRFPSAFEAAEQLADPERQLLLEQLANWLLEHMPNVSPEQPKTAEGVGIEMDEADTQPLSGRDNDPPEAA
jgi:hypothetical protein